MWRKLWEVRFRMPIKTNRLVGGSAHFLLFFCLSFVIYDDIYPSFPLLCYLLIVWILSADGSKYFPRKHAIAGQHILLKHFCFILNGNIYCFHQVIEFCFCFDRYKFIKLSMMEQFHNPNTWEMEGRSIRSSKPSFTA